MADFTGTSGQDLFYGTEDPDLFVFQAAHLTEDDVVSGGIGWATDILRITSGGDLGPQSLFGVTHIEQIESYGPITLPLSLTSSSDAPGGRLTVFGNLIDGSAALTPLELHGSNMIGGSGADRLFGFDHSSDILEGGAGDDVMNGGNTGFGDSAPGDVASYASAAGGVLVVLSNAASQDTIGAGVDILIDIESVIGSASDDVLIGGFGGGVHVMRGGSGNDILKATLGVGFTSARYGLLGEDGDDYIQGGPSDDRLDGGTGDDRLDGGTGHDIATYQAFYRGVHVDLAVATAQDTRGAGIDTLLSIEELWGSQGPDRLLGTASSDPILGQDGDDDIQGRNGNDTLAGGNGRDTLTGGAGDDILYGNSANVGGNIQSDAASYYSNASRVIVNLSLSGPQDTQGAGRDTLIEIGSLLGSAHGDILGGDPGANRLAGFAGDDLIAGRAGADTLIGGSGIDRFAFYSKSDSTPFGRDLIMDLTAEDMLDLRIVDANTSADGDQPFALASAFTRTAGEAVLVYLAAQDLTNFLGDIDADGIADMVITMIGDVRSFTDGWLL